MQHLRNKLAVDAYETHVRIALEVGGSKHVLGGALMDERSRCVPYVSLWFGK